MTTLVDQLTLLTGRLVPTAGSDSDALARLRGLIAAILIQQDPGLLPIVTGSDDDPLIVEAARQSEALAAERTAAGLRSHFERVAYLAADTGANRIAQTFAPFIDDDGALAEFRIVDVASFLKVARQADIGDDEDALVMLLPAATAADPAFRIFAIPAGTVLLPAALLVAGASGLATFRIAQGSLELATAALNLAGGELQLRRETEWQLTLQIEAAPAADAGGADGAAAAVLLPSQFFVSSDGHLSLSGAIGLSGIGSALRFEAQDAAPTLTDSAILFPYATAGESWTIADMRSPLARVTGEGIVQRAFWLVPVTQAAPADAAEAAHGGSFGAVISGAARLTIDGVAGGIDAADIIVIADAGGIELVCLNGDAAAQLDISLWQQVQTRIEFAATARRVRFHSQRGGGDIAMLSGGTIENRWDAPLAATGAPFPFAGDVIELSLVVEPDGTCRTIGKAARPPDDEMHGLAFENLFLTVSAVRAVGFAGSGSRIGELAEGRARISFDVFQGEPMLPDPYAASWSSQDHAQRAEAALAIMLDWQAGTAPDLRARLDEAIQFPPQQPFGNGEASGELVGQFFQHLGGAIDQDIGLLDLSTGQDHLGVAIGFGEGKPRIDAANRLTAALAGVRLLMQPQVHWEPVQVQPKDGGMLLSFPNHGGRTIVGTNAVRLVPILPGAVATEIAAAAGRTSRTAALFSLPFGLRAIAFLDPVRRPLLPNMAAGVRQASFDGGLVGARQLRLESIGPRDLRGALRPDRKMPGLMRQTLNNPAPVPPPNPANLPPVTILPKSVLDIVNAATGVPVHAVDLSGYGASCFSNWRDDSGALGISQVRFDVMSGRTAYEVIQVRSVLAPCQARVVRTIILERENSGRVERFDSGWQAIDDGSFNRYVPFDTGVVRALRRIRQITELPQPPLILADTSQWQAVRFDADADLENLTAGGGASGVPLSGHAGFVQTKPGPLGDDPPPERFRALFQQTGAIGGAVDCRIRVGGTLDMHLSSLFADFAPVPGFAPADKRSMSFAVGAYGLPDLPRAAQWSAVRVDGITSDVSAIDPKRGVPIARPPGAAYLFREPAELRQIVAAAEYGLLVTTPSSRVLFPRPSVDPARRGQLASDPPRLADPLCLVQAGGAFPRGAFAMIGKETPLFDISDANDWRIDNPTFTFDAPGSDIASGATWALERAFAAPVPPQPLSFDLAIDSAAALLPWKLDQPPHDIVLRIAGEELMTIATRFVAENGTPAFMDDPQITFGPMLDELKKIVDALQAFTNIQLPMGVAITVVPGLNPAFVVHLDLKFAVGTGPDGRIDIGLGKFSGEFALTGELQAALSGDSRGRLKLTFQGDIQQAILPPLLYAGGLFHFGIEVRDSGDPLIELGLGTTTSIGGDLIKGLLEVEATIKYGYLLTPQTLQPGVMLGIEARAKLLAGLFSLSFSADAIARITRLNDDKTVTIFASVRVAASIQIAFLFDEDVDFETQFEQNVPLAPLLILGNVNPLVAVATSAVL